MKAKQLVAALSFVLASTAHAAFYVDEDAPQQTATNPNAMSTTASFEVGYSIRRSVLGPSSRRTLTDRLEDAIDADQIVITGYGDAAGNSTLARQRAAAVKQWLTENGVAAGKIAIEEDTSAREPGGNRRDASKATIALRTATRLPAPKAELKAAALYRPDAVTAVLAPAARTTPAATALDAVTLQMMTKVVSMAQSNLLRPEDAYRLLAELLQPKGQQNANTLAVAAPTVIQPAPLIVPVVEQPRTWVLQKGKTLKENLDAWAATAGWSTPTWLASNPYRITEDHPMTGTFVEVLGQLANLVPTVDLRVRKSAQSIQVVDAKR